MQTVGIVSPGAMGSAVGAAYCAAGNRVVTTVDGRSDRTAALAEQAGLELLPDLDAVVGESELVLSIVPPGEAGATAAAIAAAAGRTGARPLVADWNAVSPATARELEQVARRRRTSSSSTARSRAARRVPTTERASISPDGLRRARRDCAGRGSMLARSATRSVSPRP